MVRIMVGTLIDLSRGQKTIEDVKNMLDNPSNNIFRRNNAEDNKENNTAELDMKVPTNNRIKYEKANIDTAQIKEIKLDSSDIVSIEDKLKEVDDE